MKIEFCCESIERSIGESYFNYGDIVSIEDREKSTSPYYRVHVSNYMAEKMVISYCPFCGSNINVRTKEKK